MSDINEIGEEENEGGMNMKPFAEESRRTVNATRKNGRK
jgi:hypothetical protein